MSPRSGLSLSAALLLSFGTLTLRSSAQDPGDKIASIFDRLEEGRGANLQECVRELQSLGRGAVPEIRKGLTRADAHVRTAVAAVLYANDFREEAYATLRRVMEGSDAPARRAAGELAASLASADRKLASRQKRELADGLRKIIDEQADDGARVALWRGVWMLTETIEARRRVRDIFENTRRREVKDDAALGLAEMDAFIWAKAHLQELAAEPTEKGRLARGYLKINALTEDLNRTTQRQAGVGSKYGYSLLDEVIDLLKERYHDEGKVEDTSKLVENAARGLLGSLDPYSAYYDEKAIEQLRKEELEGHYGGIGARVSMRKDKAGTSWLTIEEPIFSGPAYRRGLRTYDTILEVDGDLTANQELTEVVRKLRGKPGTEVKIKVRRAGWLKDQDFVIAREEIQLETTMSRLLPGDIGYLKYTTFGDLDDELKNKGTNIEKQIEEMTEKGMKALVLDLRGNSGGYLRTARRIASLFLEDGVAIVTTKTRGVVKEQYKTEGGPVSKIPLFVLVDSGSASASEILAGALQDHKRALLIGEKTFGKGSVQELKPLMAAGARTAARITVAKWYLPSDRSVEKDNPKESGIEVDIKVAPPDRDFWKDAEFERLRAEGMVQSYVDSKFQQHRELFRKLAEVDQGEASRYPEFDGLYGALDTKLDRNEVRELLREVVRKRVQDDQGRPLYLDFQTDVVLQRAIVEACKSLGIDPKTIKEYDVILASAPPAESRK